MSAPFSAREVSDWTRGSLLQGPPEARLGGATIDGRAAAPGQLFVAVVGPGHDAHGFLTQAASAGAAGLLVESGRELPRDLAPDIGKLTVQCRSN